MIEPKRTFDEKLLEAIAKGWGSEENAHKPMDTILASAIFRSVKEFLEANRD